MEPPVDSFLYGNILFLIVSLLCLGLFSFLETSITALRLFKLKEIEKSTSRYKELFYILEKDPNRILITILVASNFANVITAILSARLLEKLTTYLHIPESVGFVLSVTITTLSILIFELIPKNIAKAHAEKLFGSTLWVTNMLYYLLYPFVKIISQFSQHVVSMVGSEEGPIASEKEIQFLIEHIDQHGHMESQKTSMLKSIFELGTTALKEIMVPESAIVSISVDSTPQQVIDVFVKHQFSRLPVYQGDHENIIGMLYQKDFFQILSRNENKPLHEIVRPIMFVPESAKILGVLKEFREQRMHIAMVLNEYGSITGLVTLEDLIEEIVGEISDEYESIPQKVVQLTSHGWLIDASIEIEKLSPLINIEFDTEDALTLGGFLIEQFQHMPKAGEEIFYKNYHFKVQDADQKRILQVVVFQDKHEDGTHEITK